MNFQELVGVSLTNNPPPESPIHPAKFDGGMIDGKEADRIWNCMSAVAPNVLPLTDINPPDVYAVVNDDEFQSDMLIVFSLFGYR